MPLIVTLKLVRAAMSRLPEDAVLKSMPSNVGTLSSN